MVTAFEHGEQRWQVNGGEEGNYSDEMMTNGGSRGDSRVRMYNRNRFGIANRWVKVGRMYKKMMHSSKRVSVYIERWVKQGSEK